MDDERLLHKLTEDLGSAAEAEQMLAAARRLQAWRAPSPDAARREALTARLLNNLPTPAAPLWSGWRMLLSPLPWLLVRAQVRVVRRGLLLASVFILALGALVSDAVYSPGVDAARLPLALLAPLVSAVGVSLLYGVDLESIQEFLLSLPVTPRLVLLARLVLLYGVNLLAALIGSAAMALTNTHLSFLPLVGAWLAPMTFLAALAFCLTILTLRPSLSILLCALLWVSQVVALIYGDVPGMVWLPDWTSAAAQPWLWLLALGLAALGVWRAGNEERWLRRAA